ncbi:MAG: SRPBCC family protein [Chloroflexota bacterium]
MHTENVIDIRAPAEVVFDLAAAVERWPDILSHYRRVWHMGVRGASPFATGPMYAMEATRSGVPCRWVSIQEQDRRRLRILYHHVAGVTAGMNVMWRIEADGDKTVATIDHDLAPTLWWLKSRAAQDMLGRQFVQHIAQNTLIGIACYAESVESGRPGVP